MNINNTQGSQEGAYALEPRVYELGYHILSSVDEGNVEKEREALVAIITKFKGTVISEEMPALINLAYPMDKVINNKRNIFSQAYFGWIKFDLSPEVVIEFEKEIDAIESILRFILIKTIKENTIISETPYKLAKSTKKINDFENEELEGDDVERPIAETTDEGSEESESEVDILETAGAEEVIENVTEDDLTKIEGIGPKIAEIFITAGIKTFEDLSSSKVGDLRNILEENKLSSHDPKTWSKQATLAKHGKWEELKKLQDELNGGK
jgi:ribosomal protein S6